MDARPDTLLENILEFPRLLQRAGMPVSPQQSMNYIQALTLFDIGQREQVFHTARSMLVTRQEHLRLFETLFNLFWRSPAQARRWQPQRPQVGRHCLSLPPEHRPLLLKTIDDDLQKNRCSGKTINGIATGTP